MELTINIYINFTRGINSTIIIYIYLIATYFIALYIT